MFPEARNVRGERHTIQFEKAKSINHEIRKQKNLTFHIPHLTGKNLLVKKTSTK
jgi:hypothetical protein